MQSPVVHNQGGMTYVLAQQHGVRCLDVCRYLEENIGAVGVSLNAAELKELEEICPADKVQATIRAFSLSTTCQH